MSAVFIPGPRGHEASVTSLPSLCVEKAFQSNSSCGPYFARGGDCSFEWAVSSPNICLLPSPPASPRLSDMPTFS